MSDGFKHNRASVQQRIDKVSELIANGFPNYKIIDYCSKEWGVCSRTTERYIKKVLDFLKKELTHNDKEKILVEYESLIMKYELKGDTKTAMAYRFQRDKILGVLAPEKQEIKIEEIKIKLPKKRDDN